MAHRGLSESTRWILSSGIDGGCLSDGELVLGHSRLNLGDFDRGMECGSSGCGVPQLAADGSPSGGYGVKSSNVN